MTPTCQCGTPVDGATLCAGCTGLLEVAIVNISAYVQDLPTVLAKLTRYGDRYGGRTRERSLPVDMRASEVGWVAVNTVSTWCRVLLEETPSLVPPRKKDMPAHCRFLLRHVGRLRVAEYGAEAFDELTDLEQLLRRVVDRPAERMYAGPCSVCNGDLYGKPGASSVMCRPCGLEFDVAERLAWMQLQVYGRLVSASEGAALLSRFAMQTQQGTIDTWARRGRLVVKGHDGRGHRLYLFDDLIGLAAAAIPA